MSKRMRQLLPLMVILLLATAAAAQAATPVATGLDNPRGLAFAPNGALYVAEAGRGGEGPCYVASDGEENCVGATGAVTEVWRGTQRRLVSGLPSAAPQGGGGATGPHDVSLDGSGRIMVTIGLGTDPTLVARGGPLAGIGLGDLIRLNGRSGSWTSVASVAAHEAAENPDGGHLDSNPYGLATLGSETYVADAGGNSVVRVHASGRTSTAAVLPTRLALAPPFLGLPPGTQIPMEPVPTAVAKGPDGALYVGELTGFPFPVGASTIWRILPNGAVEPYRTGYTNVVDITFGPDGSLYVVEIAAAGLLVGPIGRVVRVWPNGTETNVAAGIFAPGGVAIGPDGAAYVTECTVCPGGGAVVRYPQ